MRSPLVMLIALLLVVLGAGPASAEPPAQLSDRITDEAGVLGENEQAVRESVADLAASTGIHLYAVFVSSFDTQGSTDWAEEAAELSDLDDSDLLLAVAVGPAGYEYGWWVDEAFPLREAAVQTVLESAVVPDLEASNWDAAVIDLAEGLEPLAAPAAADEAAGAESDEPAWTATTTMLVVAGLAVALLAGHLLSRRKTSAGSS
ncbi:TPM domain-containing protein [Modestobacter lapidis]|nr:TPM domain-containing protein [Modestobacter lapidis]